MIRRNTLPAFASTLALLAIFACGGPYRAAPVVPGPDSGPNVVTGTCRDYDYATRSLDLVAGVSFALRMITFKLHENTEITVGRRRAELSELQANTVLRVEYRVTPQGNLADKITVVLDARGMRGR
jgi:hypothetical protein